MDKTILDGQTINSHKDSYYDNQQRLCWVSTSKAPLPILNGKKLGMFGISRDITETVELEERLFELARIDNLTKLQNRNSFLEQAKNILTISKRQKQNCALFFIDLDKFKYINDTYGHDTGDEVLKQTANRLLDTTRESDLVCRFGGDEFLLLTILNDYSDIEIISEKIRSAVIQTIDFQGIQVEPACSIGISLYPKNEESIDKFISMADVAMYKSKKEGTNRITFYEESD